MPKMKTKSGVKKRFKTTGSGKVKFRPASKRHLLMNKPKSMKRRARGLQVLDECDAGLVRTFMPYARKHKSEQTVRKSRRRKGGE